MTIDCRPARFARQLAQTLSQSDSGVASSLNRIAMHCANEFASKMAVITALDERNQYFLGKFGIDGEGTSSDVSFCRHAIVDTDPLLVADARMDNRFLDNPFVTGDPHIRSYLGVPISNPYGELIGTICLIDDKPDHFSSEDAEALSRYARGVEDMLKLHDLHLKEKDLSAKVQEQNELLRESSRIFREAERVAKVGSWELNLESGQLSCTDGIYAIFEVPRTNPISLDDLTRFHDECCGEKIHSCISRAIETGKRFEIEVSFVTPSGKRKRFRSTGEVVNRGASLPARLVGITTDITDSYQSEVALRHAAEHDSLT